MHAELDIRSAGFDADFARELETIFQVGHQRRPWHVEPNALHCVLEYETVFSFVNGINVGADQLDVVFFQDAAFRKFDGEIERSLSADGGQNGESRAGRKLTLNAN